MADRAVLLSVKPKYCELIANGKKTVEVRKTNPKLNTPFKCYIYCTKDFYRAGDGYFQGKYCGTVIGEFVCDRIFPISVYYDNPNCKSALKEIPYVCLTDKQIIDYLGNGKKGYGWRISNLIIYEKPKELSELKKFNRDCWYADLGLAKRDCPECNDANCFLSRPPQSWCYVEAVSNNDRIGNG